MLRDVAKRVCFLKVLKRGFGKGCFVKVLKKGSGEEAPWRCAERVWQGKLRGGVLRGSGRRCFVEVC